MEHWQIVDEGRMVASNSPLSLWRNACAYFEWCDMNKITTEKPVAVGKAAGLTQTLKQNRPYSIKGLCLHCGISEEYIRDVRNSKKIDNEYYAVISKILYIIYVNNLEGAMVGVFNPIFTSKVLNMEKEEQHDSNVTVTVITDGIPELSNSENEILKRLEQEISEREKVKDKNAQGENGLYIIPE